MAITRSYNRHNNTYYAYETEYVYDEATQKKVLKRHCVGKFDSQGNVIPNGKRGRRSTSFPVLNQEETAADSSQMSAMENLSGAKDMDARQQAITNAVSTAISLVSELETDVNTIKSVMGGLHSDLLKLEEKLSAVSTALDSLADDSAFA